MQPHAAVVSKTVAVMFTRVICVGSWLTVPTLALLLFWSTVQGATSVIEANLYITDSVNARTGFKAGEMFVLNSQLRDQATNASIGTSLGFCVNLRDGGPSQCQMTLHFASGAVQVTNHESLSCIRPAACSYLLL